MPPVPNESLDRWSFPHLPRGSCVPGCPRYGRCHCGCEGRPKLSSVTFASNGRVAGQPYVFISGHYLGVVHPRAGAWSQHGVPVERIRPVIFWLRGRYGSIRAVAELVGIPESTVRGYVYNTKRKYVPPDAARRIVAFTLSHRRRDPVLSVWDDRLGPSDVEAALALARSRSGSDRGQYEAPSSSEA